MTTEQQIYTLTRGGKQAACAYLPLFPLLILEDEALRFLWDKQNQSEKRIGENSTGPGQSHAAGKQRVQNMLKQQMHLVLTAPSPHYGHHLWIHSTTGMPQAS